MGTLIDRFEEHDGPVRGVDFHKTQVSCIMGMRMSLDHQLTTYTDSLSLFPVATTTRSKSGPFRLEGVCSPSLGIWTTSEPFSSTTSSPGLSVPVTTKRFGYGTGRTARFVCYPDMLLV